MLEKLYRRAPTIIDALVFAILPAGAMASVWGEFVTDNRATAVVAGAVTVTVLLAATLLVAVIKK